MNEVVYVELDEAAWLLLLSAPDFVLNPKLLP